MPHHNPSSLPCLVCCRFRPAPATASMSTAAQSHQSHFPLPRRRRHRDGCRGHNRHQPAAAAGRPHTDGGLRLCRHERHRKLAGEVHASPVAARWWQALGVWRPPPVSMLCLTNLCAGPPVNHHPNLQVAWAYNKKCGVEAYTIVRACIGIPGSAGDGREWAAATSGTAAGSADMHRRSEGASPPLLN